MTDANFLLFVDTNILVYATTFESPFYQLARQTLLNARKQKQILCISQQVLREYLVVTTRRQGVQTPPPKTAVLRLIDFFQKHFSIAHDNADVFSHLQTLIKNYNLGGKQIHDANIVATMRAHGISQLLTYNVADFKRFEDIIQIQTLPSQ